MQNVFTGLMARSLEFNPTYEDGMANHLPMALLALRGIGADESKLEAFYRHYSTRLEALEYEVLECKKEQPVSLSRKTLGRQELYYSYYLYFQNRLSQESIDTVLTSAMAVLDEGISGSAFHCVIRLGYAVEWGEHREIAAALAFFATDYQSLGQLQSEEDSVSVYPESIEKPDHLHRSSYGVEDVIGLVQSTGSLCEVDFDAVTIIEKLDYAANILEFKQVIALVEQIDITLEDIAELCLQLYASTNNFTALHGITASHAMRILLPYCSDKTKVLRYFLIAIVAAYISIGAPRVKSHCYRGAVNWQPLLELTLESSNDHTIKLIHSCEQEYKHYKNPVYFYVAAKVLEREFSTDILE